MSDIHRLVLRAAEAERVVKTLKQRRHSATRRIGEARKTLAAIEVEYAAAQAQLRDAEAALQDINAASSHSGRN